ncbi:metal-dependent hydrolase [Acetobacteraceae bacterium H6797]|nr:metal-dependent hydrolase [Acetobacteraceae bacterium H6797]
MKVIWLGHAAYRLEFGNAVVLIDPFLGGNGSFKGDIETATAGVTHIVLTHGHGDHVGDTVAIAQRTGAKVIGVVELCQFLGAKGVKNLDPMNTGGTTDQGDFSVSLTIAFHSSADQNENGVILNLGLPNGVVITPKDKSQPTIYHMGDTEIFSDMALIAEIYEPDAVIVPIGDRFTMGPKSAALAVNRFLPKVKTVLPCHYGTFPILVQSADPFLAAMGEQAKRVKVTAPGEAFEL